LPAFSTTARLKRKGPLLAVSLQTAMHSKSAFETSSRCQFATSYGAMFLLPAAFVSEDRGQEAVMNRISRTFSTGLLAGATGTLMLNATSYLDMLIQGREASSMPAQMAGKLGEKANIETLASDNETPQAAARRSATGALMGQSIGLSLGLAYAALRSAGIRPPMPIAGIGLGLAAMAASDAPLTASGLTNPKEWPPRSWVSDIVPHMVFGFVAASAVNALTPQSSDGSS
jgi:hypothetical protein